MDLDTEEWRPGSFTKNFSWGKEADGLRQLHEVIRLGFDNEMKNVKRSVFRRRVEAGGRPDYIPINFFLFNRIINGVDHLIADELVFQALTAEHSPRFDKLGLFAFNLSLVGLWRGASPYQRRPALWAYHYVKDRVAAHFDWNTSQVSADDIEKFVTRDKRYKAKTARKLSTNLNYLYRVGKLSEFSERRVERWWVDALFLALDRLIEDRKIDGQPTQEDQYRRLLSSSGFYEVSGHRSLEKDLAAGHLVSLYRECGSRERFSEDFVRERTELRVPDIERFLANDPRPRGAVHPTNPRILKSIPRACAMLAKYAGFVTIDADEMEAFDVDDFVRRQTAAALERLREQGVKPTMTAEELMKITRER